MASAYAGAHIPLNLRQVRYMHFKNKKGQAMVEFALVFPILILLVCGIIDFGWVFANQLLANNACREAARYTAIHYNSYEVPEGSDRITVAETVAEGIVDNYISTFSEKEVTVTNEDVITSGDAVKVSINGNIKILTPVLMTIKGNVTTCAINADCTMRLE